MKKTVYIDMDNVLVDFKTGIERISEELKNEYEGRLDEVPGIFSLMEPMPDAFDSVRKLAEHYNLYILSTSPWLNPSAWTDKLKWVQKYFGSDTDSIFYKRLILTHHKDLNTGDYLIDDREKKGAKNFKGELILFGSADFPDWKTVVDYLI